MCLVSSAIDTASASGNCRSFCLSKPETWNVKCKWKAFCNGCLQCFRCELPPHDTTPHALGSRKKIESCVLSKSCHRTPMPLKCPSATTSASTTSKRRRFFIPPPINPGFKWYDWHRFNITSKRRTTTRAESRDGTNMLAWFDCSSASRPCLSPMHMLCMPIASNSVPQSLLESRQPPNPTARTAYTSWCCLYILVCAYMNCIYVYSANRAASEARQTSA